jgi:hypothetical protein
MKRFLVDVPLLAMIAAGLAALTLAAYQYGHDLGFAEGGESAEQDAAQEYKPQLETAKKEIESLKALASRPIVVQCSCPCTKPAEAKPGKVPASAPAVPRRCPVSFECSADLCPCCDQGSCTCDPATCQCPKCSCDECGTIRTRVRAAVAGTRAYLRRLGGALLNRPPRPPAVPVSPVSGDVRWPMQGTGTR